MAVTVELVVSRKFRARQKVCPALAEGVLKLGDKLIKTAARDYREPCGDVVLHYGFDGERNSNIARAFRDYVAAGKPAIYLDLAYWSRHWNGDRYGYHRFSVSARHPTAYFQKRKHSKYRFEVHGIPIQPWRKPGRNILVCGMSDKAARFEGFKFEEWERSVIEKLKAVTDRPILYRPKPQRERDGQYAPIEGVGYSDPRKPFGKYLEDAWAVVSHHSNTGIDAILAGVPCFQPEGVASVFSKPLEEIENPYRPGNDERWQFAYDVAHCQFNRPEMTNGTFWRHCKDEGLVPT